MTESRHHCSRCAHARTYQQGKHDTDKHEQEHR